MLHAASNSPGPQVGKRSHEKFCNSHSACLYGARKPAVEAGSKVGFSGSPTQVQAFKRGILCGNYEDMSAACGFLMTPYCPVPRCDSCLFRMPNVLYVCETTAGALRPRRRRTVSGDGGTSVTRIILIGGIALFLTIVAGMVLYKMRKRSSSKRKGVQTGYKRRGRSSRKLARSGSESSTADGGTDGKPAPHTPQRFRRAPSSLKKRNE
uniref:Transmembrane protein n=1 Tax=Toxoplasma gondii (strain ATCC 50861 / VEG) TaxID=432359 RepID=A0A0F7V6A4_TOXGV|nr:TPA: hypothetical protein BN1205_007735 [Toxoplasma gondii VEG]